jgi:hypothetical protein
LPGFRDDIGEMERFLCGGGSERDRGFRDDIGEMERMSRSNTLVSFRDDIGEMESAVLVDLGFATTWMKWKAAASLPSRAQFRDDMDEMEMMVGAPLLHEVSRQHDE